MENGLFMVGITDGTKELLETISRKTGLGLADVISESIRQYGLKVLGEDAKKSGLTKERKMLMEG